MDLGLKPQMGAYRRWTHLMNGAVMRANVVTSEFTSGENISEEAIREALSVDRRADHPNHEKAGCALKYDGCGRGNILWPSLSGARIIRRGSVFRGCVFRRHCGRWRRISDRLGHNVVVGAGRTGCGRSSRCLKRREYRFMNYNQQCTNQQPLSHDSPTSSATRAFPIRDSFRVRRSRECTDRTANWTL